MDHDEMTQVQALIDDSLPLLVEGIEVNDPIVTLYGDRWSLSVACPWRISGPSFRSNWESDSLGSDVAVLRGLRLESVVSRGDVLFDPVFHFSGGYSLEVCADTDLDPWALTLPHIVVIGRKLERDEA